MAAGLLGQSPLAGLLAMLPPPANQPDMAGAGDEAMFARNPNGLMAPRKRERVNPLRVLDRFLFTNDSVGGAIDNERTRLTNQANAPAMAEQQQRLRDMVAQLPPEIQLAWAANQEETGKALASNAEAWTLGAGGQRGGLVNGQQAVIASAPTYSTVNDTIYANDRGVSTPTATAAPGYDDLTARINATNPVSVAQDATLVDPYSGRTIAQGVQRPDIQNVAPGGEALAFDAAGNVINRVGSTQQRPQSAAEIKRADDLELALAQDQNSVDRVNAALALVTDPDGSEGALRAPVRVGPWENVGASLLNRAGRSNANSLGIAQIKTTVESLRQGILNDATGPQTEGDALRALNSILNGLDDPKVIAQGFQDYLAAKRRTMGVRESQISRIRGGAGAQAGASSVPPPPPGFELDR